MIVALATTVTYLVERPAMRWLRDRLRRKQRVVAPSLG
jgi:peptidoglycan/LPS O-acetylase OafA/YrhL